jgi:hypothetical protein
VGRTRRFAEPKDAACGLGGGNWSEALLSGRVPGPSNIKGHSGMDFRERDMITEAQKSAALEVRHRHREI